VYAGALSKSVVAKVSPLRVSNLRRTSLPELSFLLFS
jgi:hypothetical protein